MPFDTPGTTPTARAQQPCQYTHPLAQDVLNGRTGAETELLERFQPLTINEAIRLLGTDGAPSVEAFDRVVDAWATYRHTMHLSWD